MLVGKFPDNPFDKLKFLTISNFFEKPLDLIVVLFLWIKCTIVVELVDVSSGGYFVQSDGVSSMSLWTQGKFLWVREEKLVEF